eukprot:871630-Amphidinium_carterae.2
MSQLDIAMSEHVRQLDIAMLRCVRILHNRSAVQRVCQRLQSLHCAPGTRRTQSWCNYKLEVTLKNTTEQIVALC